MCNEDVFGCLAIFRKEQENAQVVQNGGEKRELFQEVGVLIGTVDDDDH